MLIDHYLRLQIVVEFQNENEMYNHDCLLRILMLFVFLDIKDSIYVSYDEV